MIAQIIKAVLRELVLHRFAVVFCFALVSCMVLVSGWFLPKKFESRAVIYADESNIIKPLLAGAAKTTQVVNRAKIVGEVIQSRRIMSQVVENANLLKGDETPAQIEGIINRVRNKVNVQGVGSNYIRIEYTADTANKAYRVASTITDMFLKDSADTKRHESKEAYTFIDKQVKSYKNQLQTAEFALKEFNANNIDGTEQTVNARIDTLRGKIEEIRLDIEGLGTRKQSIDTQLKKESKFVNKEIRASVYNQQIKGLKSRLSAMRLSLTDTHPDVLTLKHQISDLEKLAVSDDSAVDINTSESASPELNPLYQELRSKLSEVQVELKTHKSRLASTERLLEVEFERRKRIANSRAELAELTRDYNVNKQIYEDMLARKEKARLSMTLDIEGQGVTYKIQEPAMYPLKSIGLRFVHLFFLGPLLGLVVPIGLAVLYVHIDPKIRFSNTIKDEFNLPLLATVPHVPTPLTKRIMRRDVVLMGFVVLLVLAIYGAVAFAWIKGWEIL